MGDRIFLDTNILIYGYSHDELFKRDVAVGIISQHNCDTFISTQVLNEFAHTLIKKFKISVPKVRQSMIEISSVLEILDISYEMQLDCLRLMEKYNVSYYDGLILSTALANMCSILYTEDMQHNQNIDEALRIVNPFESE